MRKILGIIGAAAAITAGSLIAAAPAQAATSCTLVQSEIYNGANIVQWVTGLEGCSGDVYWEVQSQAADGTWSLWSSDTTHYDNNTSTYTGDIELPCVLRVYAQFGTQSKLTAPARNNNCGG